MSETPNTQSQQIKDGFKKAVEDHAGRVESAFTELAKLEEKSLEQYCAQLDEATRLTKVSMAYAGELAAQWRKLVLDATRRTVDMVAGAGSH